MGVGKGSIAREIIRQSGVIALDTDDVIESMENRKVSKIFEAQGEAYFRRIEQRVALWLEQSVRNTLISTGGGFFKVPNLKRIGTVVLLDADFDTIHRRIITHPNADKKLKKRPLFKDEAQARALYDKRLPLYQAVADVTIDVRERPVETIAEEIIHKVLNP